MPSRLSPALSTREHGVTWRSRRYGRFLPCPAVEPAEGQGAASSVVAARVRSDGLGDRPGPGRICSRCVGWEGHVRQARQFGHERADGKSTSGSEKKGRVTSWREKSAPLSHPKQRWSLLTSCTSQ